jgi:glycosyltransferase involved in cell wall biosynthesis
MKPDVLHGYLDDADIAATILRAGTPGTRLVWGVRGSRLDLPGYPFSVRRTFHLAARFSRRADLVISNSHSGAADHVAAGYPADRMRVIPNGIDTDYFVPDSRARARVRNEWNVAVGAPLIGVVGRLAPMKDHPTFLRAALEFTRRRPEARFVCVGNGPEEYRERLIRLMTELGLSDRVLWLPGNTAVRDVYNALDVLTSSSAFGEGFSNVIGEAMACGARCVVTDVGDSAMIVGSTGIVVPHSDPSALAAGWAEALQRYHGTNGEASRRRIQDEFSLPRLIDRTEATLRELIARGSREQS